MNNRGGGFFNEPEQSPNSQHIIGDERSRVWLETKDPSPSPNYPARVSASVSWVAFSALVFKLVRLISTFATMPVLLLVIGFILLPLAAIAYKQAGDEDGRFKALINFSLVVTGIVIGGL